MHKNDISQNDIDKTTIQIDDTVYDRSILPELNVNDADLPTLIPKAWDAIAKYNEPKTFFLYAGKPVRLIDCNGKKKIQFLDKYSLQYLSACATNWTGYTLKKESDEYEKYPARPSISIVQSMLSYPEIPLPILTDIVIAPVFLSDCTLSKFGYNETDQLYFDNQSCPEIEPIKRNPDKMDLLKAVEIIKLPLKDFPFKSEADRTHAIGAMLTPFVRPMIKGNVPAHYIGSSQIGNGKGLLVDTLIAPTVGKRDQMLTMPESEEEQRKAMAAALISSSSPFLTYDNVSTFSSPVLAALLTTNVSSNRILGKSEQIDIPFNKIIILTGNNVFFSPDTARRTIQIIIDSMLEMPWLRDGFTIPDLKKWLLDNRSAMISACLTICQSWIAAGMPPAPSLKPLGSFEEWTSIIGGILHYAGFNGFLSNIIESYENADIEGNAIKTFVQEWLEKKISSKIKYDKNPWDKKPANQLYSLLNNVPDYPLSGKDLRGLQRSFSRSIARLKDRVFSISISIDDKLPTVYTVQIVKDGKHKHTDLWTLNIIEPKEGA